MRIFVTGGTGFIGSHFLNLAFKEGHELVALRRSGSRPAIPVAEGVHWLTGSLGRFPRKELEGCEGLVHLAAAGVQQPTTAEWEKCLRHNVNEFHALMHAAIASRIRTFVVCGSCSEYGAVGDRYEQIPADAALEPVGAYAASKAAATMVALGLAKEKKLQLSVLRPFHVFGEGESHQRLWPSLREAARKGADFEMTAGEQVRDFVPVEEVVRAILRHTTTSAPLPGCPVIKNIGSGQPRTIRSFAERWWRQWGAKGDLLLGTKPYRINEVMRYVPKI